MSYTKRDWKFERGKFNVESDQGNRLCIGSIVANGKHYIARIENAGEDEANAHLIAAAPLLYEALKTFDHYLCASYPHNMKLKKYATKLLKQALAQAEGKNET